MRTSFIKSLPTGGDLRPLVSAFLATLALASYGQAPSGNEYFDNSGRDDVLTSSCPWATLRGHRALKNSSIWNSASV